MTSRPEGDLSATETETVPGDHAGEPVAEEERPGLDGLAVAALVTGLLGVTAFVGIVLGAVAFFRVRRSGRRGRDAAIGGIFAGAAWIAFAVLAGFPADEDPGRPTVADLRVGDCFDGFRENTEITHVTAVACTEPHEAQVISLIDGPSGGYPGDAALERLASRGCADKWRLQLANSPYGERARLSYLAPKEGSWKSGDREIQCVLVGAGDTLTVPVDLAAYSLRPDEKAWSDLRAGDCVTKVPETSRLTILTTVACRSSHAAEVAKTFELPAGAWAGDQETMRLGLKGCEKRVNALFEDDPPSQDLGLVSVSPSEDMWNEGNRTVVCLVTAEKGKLKGSVLPS